MSLDPKILEIIACPKCKGRLEPKVSPSGDDSGGDSALLCRTCRLVYPVVEDIPNLITDDAKPLES
jgi:hypothetical protein